MPPHHKLVEHDSVKNGSTPRSTARSIQNALNCLHFIRTSTPKITINSMTRDLICTCGRGNIVPNGVSSACREIVVATERLYKNISSRQSSAGSHLAYRSCCNGCTAGLQTTSPADSEYVDQLRLASVKTQRTYHSPETDGIQRCNAMGVNLEKCTRRQRGMEAIGNATRRPARKVETPDPRAFMNAVAPQLQRPHNCLADANCYVAGVAFIHMQLQVQKLSADRAGDMKSRSDEVRHWYKTCKSSPSLIGLRFLKPIQSHVTRGQTSAKPPAVTQA